MLGRSGARKAYLEGRGSVIIRAKTRVEEIRKDRCAIVIDEIPYQVNKATMIEKIAELAAKSGSKASPRPGRIRPPRRARRGRTEARRHRRGGAEPAVPLHPDADHFRLQHAGAERRQARAADAAPVPDLFHRFREEVVARRTAYELRKARERSHVLCGLAVAVTNVDEVVATIRASADAAEARERLMTRRWPAQDILDISRLIDDPTHTGQRGRHL